MINNQLFYILPFIDTKVSIRPNIFIWRHFYSHISVSLGKSKSIPWKYIYIMRNRKDSSSLINILLCTYLLCSPIVAWWRHMALYSLVNIGSSNGSLPFWHQTIPEYVCLLSVWSSNIYLMTISQEILQPSITEIAFNFTYIKFHSNPTYMVPHHIFITMYTFAI